MQRAAAAAGLTVLAELLLAAAFLGMVAGCHQGTPPAVLSAPSKKHADRLEGVENLARITPGLYRGAQPSAEGFKRLKEMGVKTVINLRSNHTDDDEAKGTGIELVHIPMHADIFGSTAPTEEEIQKFFGVVLDPAKQPVYFHCAHGKDRTGTMAALWRIEMDGWTPDEAIEEMRAFGYHTIYKDLIAFVRAYKPRGFRK